MSTAETYFITWKGRRDGPYSLAQLESLLKDGEIGLLHRVETPAGQVSLRQLLEASAPANVPAAVASNVTMETESKDAAALAANSLSPLSEKETTRLYTICGLSFAVPLLAVWAWMLAGKVAAQGHPQTATKVKMLSLGLAAGGVALWVVLWRMW